MMIVVLLSLAVALTLLEPLSFLPLRPAWMAAPAIVVYLAGAAALAAGTTTWAARAAGEASVLSAGATRRHRLGRLATRLYVVAGLAGVLLAGYRTALLTSVVLARLPLVPTLLAWAPSVVALLIVWILDYPFYRAVRLKLADGSAISPSEAGVWSLREFISYNLRHHVLFVAVPVSLIVLIGDMLRLWVYPLLPEAAGEMVLAVGSLAGAVGVFLIAPAIIVRLWRTSPLPPSQLRSTLEGLCRRLRLRYRDIRIWHSGGAIANAAMMGLIGPIRYVLISDALLTHLDARSIRAIFAHEAAHIRHHHIFYSVLFALVAMGLCTAVAQQTALWAGWDQELALMVMFPLLAAAWAFGFGWISRKFERQSDALGARLAGEDIAQATTLAETAEGTTIAAMEGVAVYCRALQYVARLNGIPMTRRNWRHGSLASRIAYLMAPGAASRLPQAIDRQVRRIKGGLWVALAVATAANVAQWLWLLPGE